MLGSIKSQKSKTLHLLTLVLLVSCNQNYQPKPKGLNQISLQKPTYKKTTIESQYEFERNTYSDLIENDEFDWVNIRYKKHTGEVLVTYKKIGSASDLILYTDEAYRLINKHKTKKQKQEKKKI